VYREALRKVNLFRMGSYRPNCTVTVASLASKACDLDYQRFGTNQFRSYFPPGGSIASFFASIVMITVGSLLVLSNEQKDRTRDEDTPVDTGFKNRHLGIGNVIETVLSRHLFSPLQNCRCAASTSGSLLTEQQQQQRRRQLLRSRQTVRKMEEDSSSDLLEDRYHVNWKQPLGEGSFGVVYLGIDKKSGERVAVKKISKKYTGAHDLQREMHALLYLKDAGGHPNICSLRENFSENGYYYLILDLIEGCEMFDHLVSQGAYSEADAARLVGVVLC
jgi:Protein kinase domain